MSELRARFRNIAASRVVRRGRCAELIRRTDPQHTRQTERGLSQEVAAGGRELDALLTLPPALIDLEGAGAMMPPAGARTRATGRPAAGTSPRAGRAESPPTTAPFTEVSR
jgi:hypothetical protein